MASGMQALQAEAFVSRRFGYEFRDLELLALAIDTTGLTAPESNSRLAILGDLCLSLVMANAWYPTGTPRGTYSTHLQQQVSNEHLATVARSIRLDRHLVLHPGHVGSVSKKTLATGLEAILGAIYLDCGRDIEVVKAAIVAIGMQMLG